MASSLNENYLASKNYGEKYKYLQQYRLASPSEQETNENSPSSKRDSLAYGSTAVSSDNDNGSIINDPNLFSHDNYKDDFMSDILKSENARVRN